MELSRLNRTLSARQRHSLASLIADPIYELVPIAGMEQAAAALPPRVRVTVTASPRLGIKATLRAAEWLAARGHDVCPHLAARSIRDHTHLTHILARIHAIGIHKVFVVGGDGDPIGTFRDGLTLLKTLADAGERFQEIGVPSYPEGHPHIADDVLLDDLREKQRYTHSTTTQMSFNPGAVAAWIARIRDFGITLPIDLGIPGVLELGKLMKIGTRIGVADSTRYLLKTRGLLGHLVHRGAFGPDALLTALAPTFSDPAANVRALHIFTMNQVSPTLTWQQSMIAELRDV
jgi:methylenetetrahydrofolate reductase (NADPH)